MAVIGTGGPLSSVAQYTRHTFGHFGPAVFTVPAAHGGGVLSVLGALLVTHSGACRVKSKVVQTGLRPSTDAMI
eukprot:6624026-Pyramimonas_sp.AAC.1